MNNILDKITFRLLIGQILPGAFLVLTVRVALVADYSSTLLPTGPKEIISSYDTALRATNSAYGLVVFLSFSAVLGLVLQTTSNLMSANRESFRKKKLNITNCWIEKHTEEIRKRSVFRKWIAKLWFERKIWLILLLGPCLMLFDFFTVLAAKPREVYKEIDILRAPTDKIKVIESILSDYNYFADYFSNMALSLACHLLLCFVIFFLKGFCLYSLPYLMFIYIIVSLHYVSFRFVRHSSDNAIFSAFSICD